MLDYTFEGIPLIKKFPIIGYEELEYNAKNRWLNYRLLKYRDEIEIFNN
jgi:NADH:ubiquinone oxidoreductase subunit C